MDPFEIGLKGFKFWRRHEIGKKMTRRLFPKIMARRDAKNGITTEDFMAETVTVTRADGSTVERIEPIIAARSSSKMLVGNGVLGAVPAVEFLQWVQRIDFPLPWLEALTNSDYFIYYGSLVISYLIARYTKSPLVPGKV